MRHLRALPSPSCLTVDQLRSQLAELDGDLQVGYRSPRGTFVGVVSVGEHRAAPATDPADGDADVIILLEVAEDGFWSASAPAQLGRAPRAVIPRLLSAVERSAS